MSSLIGQHLGQYEITALLGEGGIAAVYRAHQTSVKRDVAIKVIKHGLIEKGDFIKRFEREAQTVAQLSHPFILKVFDYGQHGDLVYLVMELLSGGGLADLIRKEPLSLDATSRMLDQVAARRWTTLTNVASFTVT
jgi:serine/threonine-protein kinase